MMNELKIFYAMFYRQIRRFLRATSRLIGTIINPLIFLVFFGLGWSTLFTGNIARMLFYGLDYLSYLAPGIYMMTLFTSGFIGGVSVLWDKEFGFLKEILVAPASRTYGILGRAFGDAVTNIIQGLIILLPMYLIAPSLDIYGLIPALVVGFIVALTFNSIGIVIASRMNSMEGFHLVINLIMWPVVFLSGAFFPYDNLPEWMKAIVFINPLTYGVDASRYFLTGVSRMDLTTDIIALITTSLVFILIAAYIFEKTTID